MKKEIKFYVIGGQYCYDCYGGAPTLIGAKRMATKHMEYWDNWQGWHKPRIYKAEDTIVITSNGNTLGLPESRSMRVPKPGAEAIA